MPRKTGRIWSGSICPNCKRCSCMEKLNSKRLKCFLCDFELDIKDYKQIEKNNK